MNFSPSLFLEPFGLVRLNCQRGMVRIALVKSDDLSFEMPKW
jgi:hypothetical protein